MQALDEVEGQLRAGAETDDERTVLRALRRRLQEEHPAFLAGATGAWQDPYLRLMFAHSDGTVLDVTHGDGYTAIVGGGVDYHGYLDTSGIIDVLTSAFRGDLTYVEHRRFRCNVADYFERADGSPLGKGAGIAGAARAVLGSIPLWPRSILRMRIDFSAAKAVTSV